MSTLKTTGSGRLRLLTWLRRDLCTLHSLKCTAWCAVGSSGVIGPFWSEDGQGRTQTVTGERYRRIFRSFVTVRQRRCADIRHSCHPLKLIQECFGTRVISRNIPHPWPANSPDLKFRSPQEKIGWVQILNPPDFFLWGYLKSLVYKGIPQTLAELKKGICAAVRAIPSHTCQRAVENLCKRAELCVARNGRHLCRTCPLATIRY